MAANNQSFKQHSNQTFLFNASTHQQEHDSNDDGGHHAIDDSSCPGGSHSKGCIAGLLLPIWQPSENIDIFTRSYRAAVYILALAYLLYGVNIITDRLVSTIEVIISVKRKVTLKTADGGTKTVKVPVWHPVVATLTVYVIGASAAEIFLPTIEIAKHSFKPDDLGPSVIVGSGAYHLFLITGICLSSVKETKSKPIEDMAVFFVTTVFAIVAYLWLFLLAEEISPGIIELWEALVTLALFPVLVLVAWAAERRLAVVLLRRLGFCNKIGGRPTSTSDTIMATISEADSTNMVENERRRRLGEILKQLKITHPEKTQFELEEMAQLKMLESAPKGAAFYRMQAAKASGGGGAVISKDKIKKRLHQEQLEAKESHAPPDLDPSVQYVGFIEKHATCIESCGSVVLTVERNGAGVDDTTLTIEYETVDGGATAVNDYEATSGSLVFAPGQKRADITVNIVDDDEFEEDKEFYVRLSMPVLTCNTAASTQDRRPSCLSMKPTSVKLIEAEIAVTILDDDHCGVFSFECPEQAIPDNIGTAKIKVTRTTGARGRVMLPFKVIPGSAVLNDDYIAPENSNIVFENNQPEEVIPIQIIDANRIGELHAFFIELQEPVIQSQPPQNPLGNPVLGAVPMIKLGICEDQELSEALDRLLKVGDMAELISSTTWADQFRDALAFSFNENNDEIGGEEKDSEDASAGSSSESAITDSHNNNKNCCRNYCLTTCCHVKTIILYIIALPWKLLAAALPPAHFLSGWLAFILLLALMAGVAAVIGDLANHFGCTVGLKNSVTAVTLIALGMGLPDTFASRHAAMHEKTADAAIGHITGSNAVNVFLGIGLSWTVAAAYHKYYGREYEVPKGSFGFIVTVYCCCAGLAVLTLLLRRLPPIRGELGGPRVPKIVSAIFLIFLWLSFIILATLRSYCIIPGF